jgi:iron complex transport system substrate-binding protein
MMTPRFDGLDQALTRRGFLVGLGSVAAAAAFLAACGDEEGGTPAAATGTAGTATGTPTAAPTEVPGFRFTDGRGITVDLPERPLRIVAQVSAAASLWDFGIRPVGIFGPQRNADGSNGPQVGDVDLSTVTSLGENWGEFDLEAFAALKPDLLISTVYAGQNPLWYVPEEAQPIVDGICPSIGIEVQGVPVVEIIQQFEDLAAQLGADLQAAAVVQAKQDFATAEAALVKAITDRPGVTVMAVSANAEMVYVVNPALAHDMLWFQNLGMDVFVPPIAATEWWEALSWEQVGAHDAEADLILVDQRTQALTAEQMAERELWPRLRAVAAGQVGPWYAETTYSWKGFTPAVHDTATALLAARDLD